MTKEKVKPTEVEKAIQPDGSLFDLGWYLHWTKGEARATLDGEFTAAELREIADHMEGKRGA